MTQRMRANQSHRIYLDFAATTPVDERVLQVMLPFFSEIFGNPSSVHTFGQQAEAALEDARETMANVLGCSPKEVVFTSCGSESDNLALRGVALAAREKQKANHILISPVEHHAVSQTAAQLASLHGFEVEHLPVDETGRVSAQHVARHLRPDTALVSVIYANNEIGTINPIAEIGRVCKEMGVIFHSDAVQAATYSTVNVNELNVDLLSLGAHKFYGPKGVGALYIREGTSLVAIQTGGGQEASRRAGTSNIPYITGMAEALRLAQAERQEHSEKALPMRDHLIGEILERIPESRLTGHPFERLPNHASFAFHGVDGNALLMMLDTAGFACSSGSACKTGDPEPSEVLTALGLSPEWALGSLRVTLGRSTTSEEIDAFLATLPMLVERLRILSQS
jgi:cysteine desulfurase